MIKRELKHVSKSDPTYTPHQSVSIVQAVKKTGRPYKIKEMSHKNFFNITNLGTSYENANCFRNTRNRVEKINESELVGVSSRAKIYLSIGRTKELETLGHVLGQCPKGELVINARHHRVRHALATSLKTLNWEIHEEVHCVSSDGSFRRADNGHLKRALVLDPTIRFERNLNQATEVDIEKKSIYEPGLPYLSQKHNGCEENRYQERETNKEENYNNDYQGEEDCDIRDEKNLNTISNNRKFLLNWSIEDPFSRAYFIRHPGIDERFNDGSVGADDDDCYCPMFTRSFFIRHTVGLYPTDLIFGLHRTQCDCSYFLFPNFMEWISSLQMTANLAAVRSVPGRSLDGIRCRHGCPEIETLAHVLGFCEQRLLLRNSTHHLIRPKIVVALRNKGWIVEEEISCLVENGSTRRVDILVYKADTKQGIIVDPTIRFEVECHQLAEVHLEKKTIYEPTVNYFKLKYTLIHVEVFGLLIGARGTIPAFFEEFRRQFALPTSLRDDIVIIVLKNPAKS
ncbi:hypothetical protein ANN_23731 [Periplaneta americana]|uniref:Uncharacterized protein n=1 Tax=Periplaneta americana TaxID=6978 RepID=A0ABQ8SN39_PERAM|nr:hypothetical protein ANN_23731 [Periplaneta americana]